MNVETLLYVYLFVCLAMIVFNIITAIILKGNDERIERVSEDFNTNVAVQFERLRKTQFVQQEHKEYLFKKLHRVSNVIAFDKIMEKEYAEDPAIVKEYLIQLENIFVALTDEYCKRNDIEAAYFAYIIKKYHLVALRSYPSVMDAMFELLDESNIYCRENAMQALYTSGNVDYVVKAIKKIDQSDEYFNGKLLADGMLNFNGEKKELGDKIIEKFNEFSSEMKVTLINYLRLSSGNYQEFAYNLLCDEKQYAEIHYACIRYLRRYPYEKAYNKLCTLADSTSIKNWEYAAIASTALDAYPNDYTVTILKRNLYSPNWYIRFNASESLVNLGLTYEQLVDVIDGNDRYASEMLRYRLQKKQKIREREKEKIC